MEALEVQKFQEDSERLALTSLDCDCHETAEVMELELVLVENRRVGIAEGHVHDNLNDEEVKADPQFVPYP